MPETRFRVISGNVGGGFGMKGGLYPEYVAVAWSRPRLTGRPVKWISERSEGLLSDEHCRDNVTEAELALDKDGRFLGHAHAHARQYRRLLQFRPQLPAR